MSASHLPVNWFYGLLAISLPANGIDPISADIVILLRKKTYSRRAVSKPILKYRHFGLLSSFFQVRNPWLEALSNGQQLPGFLLPAAFSIHQSMKLGNLRQSWAIRASRGSSIASIGRNLGNDVGKLKCDAVSVGVGFRGEIDTPICALARILRR